MKEKKKKKRLFKASVKIASSLIKSKLYNKLVGGVDDHTHLVNIIANTSIDYAKAIEKEVNGDD